MKGMLIYPKPLLNGTVLFKRVTCKMYCRRARNVTGWGGGAASVSAPGADLRGAPNEVYISAVENVAREHYRVALLYMSGVFLRISLLSPHSEMVPLINGVDLNNPLKNEIYVQIILHQGAIFYNYCIFDFFVFPTIIHHYSVWI